MEGAGADVGKDLLGPMGLLIATVLVILSAVKENSLWVPGWMYRRDLRQCREDAEKAIAAANARADRWERMALSTTSLAEKAVEKIPER